MSEIKKESDPINFPAHIDEAELAQKIDPLSFDVLRNGATERPFTGEYNDTELSTPLTFPQSPLEYLLTRCSIQACRPKSTVSSSSKT
jgi:hypothetical protein